MTSIIIPEDPAGRLKWAKNILRNRREINGVVSGPDIIRMARRIVEEAERPSIAKKNNGDEAQ
ncbi:hypothetical protein KIH24_05655 [Rhizobiales bacterium TNE-4]|nr:hypothetical protein [Rhizobiales bacterium TNE-4]MBV1827108.1 hypothetical protein [Rhizobiales bacterium TNE-4]